MADEFERKEMAGVGEVLHRYRAASPPWLLGLTVVLSSAGLFGSAIATALAGPAMLGAALGLAAGGVAVAGLASFLMITFAVGRVAVSEGELDVKLGLWGPKIPIADIASVTVAPSGTNRIGMGVGNDLQGRTTYRMWGDNARAVHVRLTSGKTLVLVTKDGDALAGALREAMARRASVKVRVALDEAEEAMEESVDAPARAKREPHGR